MRKAKTYVARLKATIDKDARNVKYYTVQYEDRRKIVDEFGDASTNEAKKIQHVHSDLLDQRERRLDAARVREAISISNLTNCCIADNNN